MGIKTYTEVYLVYEKGKPHTEWKKLSKAKVKTLLKSKRLVQVGNYITDMENQKAYYKHMEVTET